MDPKREHGGVKMDPKWDLDLVQNETQSKMLRLSNNNAKSLFSTYYKCMFLRFPSCPNTLQNGSKKVSKRIAKWNIPRTQISLRRISCGTLENDPKWGSNVRYKIDSKIEFQNVVQRIPKIIPKSTPKTGVLISWNLVGVWSIFGPCLICFCCLICWDLVWILFGFGLGRVCWFLFGTFLSHMFRNFL